MNPTQQSFLVITKDKEPASSYIVNLLKEKKVDSLDVNHQMYEKIMGIEEVRNIQKAILLKPFRGKTKAVIIEAYENITLEAQNALLKILEEPPANTIVVILITKRDLILPTIISRCKIITLREKEIKLNENDLTTLQNTLNTLLNGKIGDKLKIAQDVATDKNVDLWLEKMAIFVKNKLTQNNKNLKYLNFLKELQKTYKKIESTNVSQRVALENFFLSF